MSSFIPRLKKLDIGPAAFTLIELALVTRRSILGTLMYDLEGSINAKQYGLAIHQIKEVLGVSIDIYVAKQGYISYPVYQSRQHFAENQRFITLRLLHPRGSEIYNVAWSIQCANPDSPEEVLQLVERCKLFVAKFLGVKWNRDETMNYSNEREETLWINRNKGLLKLAEHLDLHSNTGGGTPEQIRASIDKIDTIRDRIMKHSVEIAEGTIN